jgi:hypothetical protein
MVVRNFSNTMLVQLFLQKIIRSERFWLEFGPMLTTELVYGIFKFLYYNIELVLVIGVTVTFRTMVCPWPHGSVKDYCFHVSARMNSADYILHQR